MIRVADHTLYQGDCLKILSDLDPGSIDLILTDPPYGTTQCKWDSVIPLREMWECLKYVTYDRTPIALFGSEPFSSKLRVSNLKMFKYDWVWIKDKKTGHLNCKKQPLRDHENISVFYKKQPNYKPLLTDKIAKNIRPDTRGKQPEQYSESNKNAKRTIPLDKAYPTQSLKYGNCSGKKSYHPTQKPVALLEYLIKTYTNEGDTVLDFTMGSGSTGVACENLNRKFIGIELEEKYFDIAVKRIIDTRRQTKFKARHYP